MSFSLFSSFVGCIGVVFFSVCMLFSGDLIFFWLFLELSGLCLIPCFFAFMSSKTLVSLFSYIVVSSISSSLLLFGLLCSEFVLFFVLGLLLKFGVFPFFGWVYNVVVGSNWLVVWCLSTFLKLPFFYVCYFLSGFIVFVGLVYSLCFVSFILLGVFFWVYSINWFYCWCHMMISSSVSFLLMSFNISLDLLFFVFMIYVFWASAVIYFIWCYCASDLFFYLSYLLGVFFYCAVLLATPVSLALFYKLSVSCCIYSCGLLCVVGWVFYSVSEQLYITANLVSGVVPKCFLSFCNVV